MLSEPLFSCGRLLRLAPALGPRPAALDSLGFWPVDVVRRNPALVIRLGAAGDRGSVGPYNRDLVRRINFLRSERRLLGPFTSFSTTALLREESADPGAVDEVTGASKGSEED